ncbi:MAG TPA: hypothetical protein VES93_12640, partial [Ornithinibacter sp.]|nr:hypothetical protein [Ornithinibacter sp.]
LGASGTAEFTARPGTTDPVLIGPDVLNRVDADVVVTATPSDGASAWMALANPSDATAVVGASRHVAVTGVSVRDWALLTTTTGTGAGPELGVADLWRQQDDAEGPVTLTVEQSGAPVTVVVATEGGELDSLTMTVVDKSWFVEAVIAALVGLFLLVAGVVLVSSRRGRPAGSAVVPPGTFDPDRAVGDGDGVEPTVPLTVAAPVGVGEAPVAADAPETFDPHDPHDPEEVTR